MLWRQSKSPTSLRKDNRGVTLIEMIAVIAVLSIVMAAVTGFVISGAKMSAKVSSSAGDSIKEQTVVEYINRWIWEADEVCFNEAPLSEDLPDFLEEGHTYYSTLNLDGGAIQSNGSVVVYQRGGAGSPIELCSGNIYFEAIEDHTVTYYLNGERHVVHLRADKITTQTN